METVWDAVLEVGFCTNKSGLFFLQRLGTVQKILKSMKYQVIHFILVAWL